jgi:hypothetical protein
LAEPPLSKKRLKFLLGTGENTQYIQDQRASIATLPIKRRNASIRSGRIMTARAVFIAIAILTAADPASATQTHGGPEGLVVHQIAHLFFLLSMGTLAYWIKARGLFRQRAWRLIRYAAIMLMVWNADAFIAHLLDEQTTLIAVHHVDAFHLSIVPRPGLEFLAPLYYLFKLDHLFCVPALVLLYLGLRSLLDESRSGGKPSGVS